MGRIGLWGEGVGGCRRIGAERDDGMMDLEKREDCTGGDDVGEEGCIRTEAS